MHLVPFRSTLADSFRDDFEQNITRLLNNFFAPDNVSRFTNRVRRSGDYPRMDVSRSDTTYRIDAAVPGVTAEDLKVETLEDGGVEYVRISGRMEQESWDEGRTQYVRELKRGQFSRLMALPEEVEGEPTARLKDGILSLTWKLTKPDLPDKKAKLISVKND